MVDGSGNNDWYSEESRRQRDKEMYDGLKSMIDNGVEVSRIVVDVDGDTLLIAFSEQGLTDTFRLLLSVPGVDIHAKNNIDNTAFDVAANSDIKKMLKDAEQGIFTPVLRGGPQRG